MRLSYLCRQAEKHTLKFGKMEPGHVIPVLLDGKPIGQMNIRKVKIRVLGRKVWKSRYTISLDKEYGGSFKSDAMHNDEARRMIAARLRKYGIEV